MLKIAVVCWGKFILFDVANVVKWFCSYSRKFRWKFNSSGRTITSSNTSFGTTCSKRRIWTVDRVWSKNIKAEKSFWSKGEVLLLAYDQDQLIACGGLNQQWVKWNRGAYWARTPFLCYIKYRKDGVGRQLLATFRKMCTSKLFCTVFKYCGLSAASFYQKQNYVFVENHPNYNYFKYLIYSLLLRTLLKRLKFGKQWDAFQISKQITRVFSVKSFDNQSYNAGSFY